MRGNDKMTRVLFWMTFLFPLLGRQPRMGRDSIAQGALALDNDIKYYPSPEGARFQFPQTHRVILGSRPVGASGLCGRPNPGLTRPGLSNPAPLGLNRRLRRRNNVCFRNKSCTTSENRLAAKITVR